MRSAAAPALILHFILLSALGSSSALAGNEHGNGGDGYALEFVEIGKRVVGYLGQSPLPEVSPAELAIAIDKTKVNSLATLTLNGFPVDAINYPDGEKPRIEVSRTGWDRMEKQYHRRVRLVLHEYLGIMRLDDANYQISSKLVVPEQKQPGKTLQIALGHDHSCALLTDGIVKCFGENKTGQLGYQDAVTRKADRFLDPVALGDGRRAESIVSGESFNCALLDDRTVKCWGSNPSGQLGIPADYKNPIGDQPNEMGDRLQRVPLPAGDVQMLVGDAHSACAVHQDGKVRCWGAFFREIQGEAPLLLGPEKPDGGFARKVIALGIRKATGCALFDDGRFQCWESEWHPPARFKYFDAFDYRRYGNVRKLVVGGPRKIYLLMDSGKLFYPEPDRHEFLLRGIAHEVSLGGTRVEDVSCGEAHCCAKIREASGTSILKCWGESDHGQIGLEDREKRVPEPKLPYVDVGAAEEITHISTGAHDTCVIFDDRNVRCWGKQNGHGADRRTMGSFLPDIRY